MIFIGMDGTLFQSELTISPGYFNLLSYISFYAVFKFIFYLSIFLILCVLVPASFMINLGAFKFYKKILSIMFSMVHENSITDSVDYESETNVNLSFKNKKAFKLDDVAFFANAAAKAIVDDNVLKRFTSQELPSWNLMARSYSSSYEINRVEFFICSLIGILYRYFIQLPCRILLIFITTLFLTLAVLFMQFLPERFQKVFAENFNVIFCRCALGSLGIFAKFHNLENLPTKGIVVSNHTSPIDSLVLGSMHFYRFVGQIQPGYFAYLQRHLSNMGHIFFERNDVSDRSAVTDCIKEHATNPDLPPVIMFPEGTCINNTSVMQFRKGTFEICDKVHPVAIKYNPMFGDPFWNSSKLSYGWYLIHVASCWCLYCDVWFLPALTKNLGESGSSFASRVQQAIANKAQMINLDWDGNLKRSFVPTYLKKSKQKEYADSILIEN